MKEENISKEEYRETELGFLPESWKIVKLGDVAKIDWGNTSLTKAYYKPYGYPAFSATGQDGFLDFYEHEGEAIIVSAIGAHCGKCFFASGKWVAIKNTIIVKTQIINIRFLYYLLNDETKWPRSGSGQPFIGIGKARELLISFPPLSEQKKIAYVLSTIQNAKEKTEQVIQATKELKKSLMKKLFTEGVIIGFMFDTNIFNDILDQKIPIESLPGNFSYFVTHIQRDEIKNTSDPKRKQQLMKVFEDIKQNKIPTSSAVWDVSRWGESKWSDGKLYEKILNDLNEIKKKDNNIQDVLIGETAIKNGLILVTNDKALAEAVKKNSGEAITLNDFLKGEYQKLKETEIGMIPEWWKVKEIKNIVIETEQKDMRKENIEFKYIDVSSVDRNNLRIANCRLYKGKKSPSRARKVVHTGDVIIATVRPTLKRIAIINNEYDNQICSTAFCVLRAQREKMHPQYLFYSIQRDEFIDKLRFIQRGASYPAITDKDVKNQKIPLPPLPIQKEIASILSAVDEKIQAEESKKKALEELFKSMLDNLITAKIRVNNLEVENDKTRE